MKKIAQWLLFIIFLFVAVICVLPTLFLLWMISLAESQFEYRR